MDPTIPLDAHTILGIGSKHLGQPGSDRELAWLHDLELERADDVVVWYGGDK